LSELARTARRLANAASGRPSQADLRRAVSTAYYAMFSALARLCADEVVGSSPARRALPEWVRVYRALEHGRSEAVLAELDPQRAARARQGLPSCIDTNVEVFCETLERMKAARHAADYDPRPLKLKRQAVLTLIAEAEASIALLQAASANARRQLAFACVVARRRA